MAVTKDGLPENISEQSNSKMSPYLKKKILHQW